MLAVRPMANTIFVVPVLVTTRMVVESVIPLRLKPPPVWQQMVWLAKADVQYLPIPWTITLCLAMPRHALRRLVKEVLGKLLVAVEEWMVMKGPPLFIPLVSLLQVPLTRLVRLLGTAVE